MRWPTSSSEFCLFREKWQFIRTKEIFYRACGKRNPCPEHANAPSRRFF